LRSDRRRDGGNLRGQRGRDDGLRHVQSDRPRHGDFEHPTRRKTWRKVGYLEALTHGAASLTCCDEALEMHFQEVPDFADARDMRCRSVVVALLATAS